jgi:predicted DNA-binding ribbon-helix-helix protein
MQKNILLRACVCRLEIFRSNIWDGTDMNGKHDRGEKAFRGHRNHKKLVETGDGVESRSTLVSRNITVLGRRTSVRLEPEMWNALRDIARRERCKVHDICSLVHLRKRECTSLTAAIRVFLMLYYRAAATEEGHGRAGHGNFDNMVRRARLTREMLASRKPPADDPLSDREDSGANIVV